jgi:hypothetical protein
MNNTILKIINRYLMQFGVNLIQFLNGIRSFPLYILDYISIQKNKDSTWPIYLSYPCFSDKWKSAGTLDKHYFLQDIYVSKKIYINNPKKHIDVGSRIDGFIAQISIFRSVEIIDIRPLNFKISNVSYTQADISKSDFKISKSDSVSCLHTVEHIGLGRYNDPLGLNLWEIAFDNIWSIVDNGGLFYFSTPIGKQRIEFNAHRVFKPSTIINRILNGTLIEFSYIDDNGIFSEGPIDKNTIDSISSNFSYGLGIFIFKKNA